MFDNFVYTYQKNPFFFREESEDDSGKSGEHNNTSLDSSSEEEFQLNNKTKKKSNVSGSYASHFNPYVGESDKNNEDDNDDDEESDDEYEYNYSDSGDEEEETSLHKAEDASGDEDSDVGAFSNSGDDDGGDDIFSDEDNEKSDEEGSENNINDSDESVSNSSIDSDEDMMDGDSPMKTTAAYDGHTRAILRANLAKASTTSDVGFISHIFTYGEYSYTLGVTPLFDKAWMLTQDFMQPTITETLKLQFKEKKTLPMWISTIEEVYIRATPHGDNRYKRDGQKRYKHFIWINQVPSNKKSFLPRRTSIRGMTMCTILKDLSHNDMLEGMTALLKKDSEQDAMGHWNGLFGYFMRRCRDENAVTKYITGECLKQFSRELKFQEAPICFDQLLTDYDIKRLAQTHLGATSWSSVPESVRKVFYKEKYRLRDIPDWNSIVEEPR